MGAVLFDIGALDRNALASFASHLAYTFDPTHALLLEAKARGVNIGHPDVRYFNL